MPIFIPKPEEQATYFASYLEAGESIVATFWMEERLPWWMQLLIDQFGSTGEILFMKYRNRYFAALTDHRLLLIGSSGMHDPIAGTLEALPRQSLNVKNFINWLGHLSMTLSVYGERSDRLYRIPRSQKNQAEAMKNLKPIV